MANVQKDWVLEELENGVMRLILNDEKRRNALSENMLDALHEKIMDSAENPKIRVVIISAKGPVFCAGHDLKEITQARDYKDDGIIYFQNLFDKCSEVMKGIVTNPKPFIAEVNGIATALVVSLLQAVTLRLPRMHRSLQRLVLILDYFVLLLWLLYQEMSLTNMLWKCYSLGIWSTVKEQNKSG